MTFNLCTRLLTALTATVLLGTAGPAGAQKAVTQGAQVSESFTIEAIDYTARLVVEDRGPD